MPQDSKVSSKKNEVDKELAYLRKKISEMEKFVNENSYYTLLKLWGKFVGVTLGAALITAVVVLALYSYYPQTFLTNLSTLISSTKIEELVGSVLGPSVTAIGLAIGFTPVISFFFVNDLKEDRRNFEQEEKTCIERLSVNRVLTSKEHVIVETYYSYLNLIINNRTSDVLKYVRTFLTISLVAVPLLIEAFVVLNPVIFIITDLFLIIIVVEGIIPILSVCTYKPAIRITECLVPGKEPNTIELMKTIEAEDDKINDKKTEKTIKELKKAVEEGKVKEKHTDF